MDYKELIEELRMVASWKCGDCYDCNQCIKAANAIETLLAERDAAVKDLRRDCYSCSHQSCRKKDFPCFSCRHMGGFHDYWQWRGPKKEVQNGP